MITYLKKIKRKFFGPPPYIRYSDVRIDAVKNILDAGLGHLNSVEKQKPIDAQDNPLPWFTYPAIEYLKQLDLRNLTILEWGIGNSSLFFADRCAAIFSVEHNEEWFELIKEKMPANAKAFLSKEDEYPTLPYQFGQKFDIIIVDGIKRAECLNVALQIMKDDGIIIFDNSDRNPDLCKIVREHNLIQIDFHGFGPINTYSWTTTLFFSRKNIIQPLSNQPLISTGGGY